MLNALGFTKYVHSCPFILGDFSLRHYLETLYIWAALMSYSLLVALRRFESTGSFEYLAISGETAKMLFLSTTCVSYSFWKMYRLFPLDGNTTFTENSTEISSLRKIVMVHVVSSILVASPSCLIFSTQHLLAISISLFLYKWTFLPLLMQVCISVSTPDYSKLSRDKFIKNYAREALCFFLSVKSLFIDHYFKLFALSLGTFSSNAYVASVFGGIRFHLFVIMLSTFTFLPASLRLHSSSIPFSVSNLSEIYSSTIASNRWTRMSFFNSMRRSNCITSHIHAFPIPVRGQSHSGLLLIQFCLNAKSFCSALLILFNLKLWLMNFSNSNVPEQSIWAYLVSNVFNLLNLWILLGTVVIFRSLAFFVIHFFSTGCGCDVCVAEKFLNARKRLDSETLPSAANFDKSNAFTTIFKKECNGVVSSTVQKDAFPIPEDFAHKQPGKASRVTDLSDSEVLQLIHEGKLKTRDLESALENLSRAVSIRRQYLSLQLTNPHSLERIPHCNFDYRAVVGQCCEEVIGYVPLPLGKVGPLLLDGQKHFVPLATTEGCLVASTNRGCRALFLSGGVKTAVFRDQMTRSPVVAFHSVTEVVECIAWLESPQGFGALRQAFNETSSHADLLSIFPNPSGRYLHLRFAARTGEAMGMNMVTKGTDRAMRLLSKQFPKMQVISLSGNMCTDKKPAAINYILGRGKSVLAEARLPATVLSKILHTDSETLANLARVKNWTGSAMAGSPGMAGCNAHAANLIAALFAATGQDLAQVVDSSACLTFLEPEAAGGLYISVTMPCLEVGTVGGGTRLPVQRACIEMLDLCLERPAEHLARLFAGVVVAGELSLLAALATNDLVEAHMRLNRASVLSQLTGADSSDTAIDPKEEPFATVDERVDPDVRHSFM